jgi:polar amino acid transport system substrate-binding protein
MPERREILTGTALAGLLSVAAMPAARAEELPSTWERIRQTKTLRLAGAISEAWCFKDTSGSTAPGSVKVGDTVWRGLGPVITDKLATALGAKLEMVETAWGNAVAGLQANQFDVVLGFDVTPERAAAVDFIPQAFLWVGTALLAKPEVDVSNWDAINRAKLRIATPSGTSMQYELAKRSPQAQLQLYPGYNEVIAAFQSGRADAISASITTANLLSARLPGTVAHMPQPYALSPLSGAVRQEIDPRFRNYMATAIGYYAHNGIIQQAVLDTYAFRGVDVSKVESIPDR